MAVVLNTNDRTLMAEIIGDLDHHTSEEIRSKLDFEIDDGDYINLILDFSKVSFMDSSGIGMIIGRYKKIKSKDGKIIVIRLSKYIDKVFELSGLKKIILIEGTLEDAYKILNGGI